MTTSQRRWLAGLATAALAAAGGLALISLPNQEPGTGGRPDPERAEHYQMMQRMRVKVTAGMVEQMRSDPMWQRMRDPRYIRLMEQEQADIDQMLGRNPAPRR